MQPTTDQNYTTANGMALMAGGASDSFRNLLVILERRAQTDTDRDRVAKLIHKL